MSRTIIAAVAFGLVAATAVITWSRLVQVEPEVATSVTRAEAAAAIREPMVSPLEIMVSHGKNLPAEVWDAF
jgi:hypothetical protein